MRRVAMPLFVAAALVAGLVVVGVPPAQGATDVPIVFAAAPDDTSSREIFTVMPDGSGLSQLTDNSVLDDSPALSPDHGTIAFTATGRESAELVLMDVDGGNRRTLVNQFFGGPSWSPDGSKLAVVGAGETIHVIDVATGQATSLTNGSFPDWAPDGSEIAFFHFDNGARSLRAIKPDGTGERTIVDDGGGAPDWSPDSTKLVFSTGGQVHVVNRDGSGDTVIADASEAAWSPAGDQLVLNKQTCEATCLGQLFVVNADGSGEQAITEILSSSNLTPDWGAYAEGGTTPPPPPPDAESAETARLAGTSRYATAVKISQAQFADGANTVYLARAVEPLVDAVAGGSLDAGPILLVPPCADLPSEVSNELARLSPDAVVALGGPGAICADVLDAAGSAASGASTSRLAGSSRYETAVEISKAQFPDGAPTVYLARAVDPLVDAVAGGSLTRGPVLLVPPCDDRLPSAVSSELQRLDPNDIYALGGRGAICEGTLELAGQAVEGDTATGRLAGTSRYETAVAIAEAQFPAGATTVYLARAIDPLVDAVAGGSLTDGPILLVPPCDTLPAAVSSKLRELAPDRVVALGGTGAICNQVLSDAGKAAAS